MNIFETGSRAAYNICESSNLPAYYSKRSAKRKAENLHQHILALWQCPDCGCYHFWSAETSDTNGACLCGSEGKSKKQTHRVKVVHYFSFLGHVASGCYCEKHANEVAEEYKLQIKTRKYRRK